MRYKVPEATAAAGAATAIDLSGKTILLDPGSYLDPDNRTSTNIPTNDNGAVNSLNANTFAMLDLDGDTDDGLYVWDLTRDNAGTLDKMGLLLGFYDSSNTAKNILGGMFETASVRTVNVSSTSAVTATTESTLTRVEVSVHLRTDGSGDRVIGPGTLEAYNGTTKLDCYEMLGRWTVTPANLKKVCAVRRGASGSPSGDFDYTLTEVRRDV
jgi:hypothetical protein